MGALQIPAVIFGRRAGRPGKILASNVTFGVSAICAAVREILQPRTGWFIAITGITFLFIAISALLLALGYQEERTRRTRIY
jgi:hypothetical protein